MHELIRRSRADGRRRQREREAPQRRDWPDRVGRYTLAVYRRAFAIERAVPRSGSLGVSGPRRATGHASAVDRAGAVDDCGGVRRQFRRVVGLLDGPPVID